MLRTLTVLLPMAILILSGCASTSPEVDEKKVAAYLADKPKELHPLFRQVVAEGERNHVLHRLRAGLAAMELGHDELAARTFDEALLTIETIYGGDEKAKKARDLFNAEDRKVFRGEPYERAMAFYYRGILYLMKGDYENARASFKSGSLQDSLAEKEEHREDFALLDFLSGWASQCNGNADLASEAYASAKSHNGKLVVPASGDNLLALAELGYAPVKYADGEHGELLKIKDNEKSGPESARITVDGSSESLRNGESILWQAMTRGGREFDSVLAGKVNFKESADDAAEVGTAIATAGSAISNIQMAAGDFDAAGVSGAIGLAGGVFSMFASAASSATETAADIRQWDNLPEKVAYGTFRSATSQPEIRFGAGSAGTTKLGGGEVCKVAWARAR